MCKQNDHIHLAVFFLHAEQCKILGWGKSKNFNRGKCSFSTLTSQNKIDVYVDLFWVWVLFVMRVPYELPIIAT